MAKKQVIKLTEGDLHRMVKESVNEMLSEKRKYIDYYNNNMEREIRPDFDAMVKDVSSLIIRLDRIRDKSKDFGYTKSYKRLSNALTYAEKAADLIDAAKQDMLGEYHDKSQFEKPINMRDYMGNEGSGFSSDGMGYF